MKSLGPRLKKGKYPYRFWIAKKLGTRKPSPAQQNILDQMQKGVWYEKEHKDRIESLDALTHKGWIMQARLHIHEDDQTALLQLLFDGGADAPFMAFRLRDPEHEVQP